MKHFNDAVLLDRFGRFSLCCCCCCDDDEDVDCCLPSIRDHIRLRRPDWKANNSAIGDRWSLLSKTSWFEAIIQRSLFSALYCMVHGTVLSVVK